MAQEFLETQAPLHPSFRMDTLLHEIRDIELQRHGPIQGPGVAELATAETWEMTHDWTEIKHFDPENAMPTHLGANWPYHVPSILVLALTSLLTRLHLTWFPLGFDPTSSSLLRSQGTPLGGKIRIE
uniref:Uncharacterized protein n=1 Tax=Timema genevievae TaxID=629358 RepID=A0A7R9K670_TIMGE|nr:unnamed protein product [Timema genevievae]